MNVVEPTASAAGAYRAQSSAAPGVSLDEETPAMHFGHPVMPTTLSLCLTMALCALAPAALLDAPTPRARQAGRGQRHPRITRPTSLR